MANPLFTQIVVARAKAALSAAASLTGVSHQLVKGRLRELVIDQLLRPVLPPSFGLGTGIIVDSEGASSGEIDIIVFNREILAPLMFSERDGVFPVEACLYAIEVKSVLERGHISETVEKLRKLRQLRRLPGANPMEPLGTLLAFGDRVATERDAILQHCDSVDPTVPLLILVGCVAGRAYWYFRQQTNSWGVFDTDSDHSELVSFLGGFANSITSNGWSPIRRGALERGAPLVSVGLGYYIIREGVSRDVLLPPKGRTGPRGLSGR